MRFRLRGQRPKLSAAEVNKWNRQANRAVLAVPETPPTSEGYNPNSRVAFCKNVSSNTRTKFDCMAITGMVWDLNPDGTHGLVFEINTADPDKPPAILVTPIGAGRTGLAVVDGLALAKVGAGSDDLGVPDAANHRIDPDPDGAIKLLVFPHASEMRLLPVVLNAGSGGAGTGITDLRLSGNNLQYFKNGSWTTWHTATTCS